ARLAAAAAWLRLSDSFPGHIDEQANAKSPRCQPQLITLVDIVPLQVDDDAVRMIDVEARCHDALVGIIAADIEKKRDRHLEIVGVVALAADENQAVRRLFLEEDVAG